VLPCEAIEAVENDVGGLLFRIMDLRAYAEAKRIYDSTPMDKRPKTKILDMVSEIKASFVRERIAEHERQEREKQSQ
jgi:hypothetical protein